MKMCIYLFEGDNIYFLTEYWSLNLVILGSFLDFKILNSCLTYFYISRRRRRDISLSISVRPSGAITKRNFTKRKLNMYHYNDVMHVKFGQAGLGSSCVIALELI